MRAALVALFALLPLSVSAEGFSDLYRFNPEPEKPPEQVQDHRSLLMNGIPSLDAALPPLGAEELPSDISDLAAGPVPQAAASDDPTSMLRGSARDVCILAIQQAETHYGIPKNLLLAIGLQEAGVQRDGRVTIWPWSVNSHGKGYTFESREAAVDFVNAEHAAGRNSIDSGCLQINARWHPDAFAGIDQAFDPAMNADYAARYLIGLYQESGDWMTAAGNYHSKTAEHHERYLKGVRQNIVVAQNAFGTSESGAEIANLDVELAAALGQYANNDVELAIKAGPGWGSRTDETGEVNLSIYSARPIEPVISNLASFPET